MNVREYTDPQAAAELMRRIRSTPTPKAHTALWRLQFLRRLRTLDIDSSFLHELAHIAHTQPWRLFGEGGRPLTWEQWADAVQAGQWTVVRLGPKRMQRLSTALANQAAGEQ